MKTLVTGAAGFIGSHLCEALLARGDEVVGLDNFNDYYDPAVKRRNVAGLRSQPGFTLVEADIRDRPTLANLFAIHQFERLAHLAAMANVRYSIGKAPLYEEVNVRGTLNLLDLACDHGLHNVVFASTSSVYGLAAQTPTPETAPTDRPLAPYPATKKAGEILGYTYHHLHGLNFTALRFFSVYGPRSRPDMMPYMVADRLAHGQPITLFNSGQFRRDWTFIGDIIAGVLAALDAELGYEILNLGRGEPIWMTEFISILEGLTGRPAILRDTPAPSSEPPINYADITRARQLLGYSPQTSVHEGLAQLWTWYQEQQSKLRR